MGRERNCAATLCHAHGQVRALLESEDIVLRGDIAATFLLSTLRTIRTNGSRLEADTERGPLSLDLGATEAAAWLARIKNPRSLLQKLGVEPGMPVHVVEDHREPRDVLSAGGIRCVALEHATMIFAVIETEQELDAIAQFVRRLPAPMPLWVLRLKGKNVALKESAIMARLKTAGLVPSKSAAWSNVYAADRYGRTRT